MINFFKSISFIVKYNSLISGRGRYWELAGKLGVGCCACISIGTLASLAFYTSGRETGRKRRVYTGGVARGRCTVHAVHILKLERYRED